MNKSMLYSAITAALAINIAACGSGSSGSDVAGIGGSGITPTGGVISSGTITGFGSIFVNGVEFETPPNVTIDDNPSSDDQLALGMRVTVNGTVNADGVTGTAESVSYDDDLDGPVSNLAPVGNDGLFQTLTVLGRQVHISSTSTSFDVTGDLAGTTFDFDSIANDNHVEISGFLNSSGVLIATRVELKALVFDTSSIVEIKGIITSLNGAKTNFNLVDVSGINIDTSDTTIIDNLPDSELADGAFVEVKGNCNASCSTITATRIEGESLGFGDDDNVEIEGVITRYVSDSDFDVNGFPVDASGTSVERIPSTLKLGIDKEIEVEGTVVSGKLIATKVKDEGGEIKIAATVAAGTVNESAGSFDLEPVAGQTITVKVDTSTQFEDEFGTITNPATLFTNLNDGDYLVIEGYDDGSGTVIASEFERESANDILLQGIMESFTPDSEVTVLGVQFQVQLPETEFENADDSPISQSFFDANTNDGVTLIKIKDKNDPEKSDPANGVADEIEIEN